MSDAPVSPRVSEVKRVKMLGSLAFVDPRGAADDMADALTDLGDARARIATLEAERNDLLAACKSAAILLATIPSSPWKVVLLAKLNAAIAKANDYPTCANAAEATNTTEADGRHSPEVPNDSASEAPDSVREDK